ncbi:hypothetical protein B0T18DRAFT_390288 [Schizothecium vesticola]|uniref:Uncharacterized protein n=1 Tax=Schizothecium vesticola TaxID=314040 RepID=A0AA40K4L1_9PEZI|nr:hypothetical protein B0T18DRAFT_390288 [Schizothecium vesticola]
MSTTGASLFSARTGLIAVVGITALYTLYKTHRSEPSAVLTAPGAASVRKLQGEDANDENKEEEVEGGPNNVETLSPSEGYDSHGKHSPTHKKGRQSAMTVLHTSQEWAERFLSLVDLEPSPSLEPEEPLPQPHIITEEVISRRRRNISIDGVVFILVDLSIPEEEDEPIPPLPSLGSDYDGDGFWVSTTGTPDNSTPLAPVTLCDSLLDFTPRELEYGFQFPGPSQLEAQSKFPGNPAPRKDDGFPGSFASGEDDGFPGTGISEEDDEFPGSLVSDEDDGFPGSSSLNINYGPPSNPCIVLPSNFEAEVDPTLGSAQSWTPLTRDSIDASTIILYVVFSSDLGTSGKRNSTGTPLVSYPHGETALTNLPEILASSCRRTWRDRPNTGTSLLLHATVERQ